jgi:hypothetical protein
MHGLYFYKEDSIILISKRLPSKRDFGQQEKIMKLPFISATIVVYTILAAAWLCYAELTSAFRAGAPF